MPTWMKWIPNSWINWITNITGTVAGVPQLIQAYVAFQSGDVATAIPKAAEGIGLLVLGYFIAKRDPSAPQ